MTNFTKAPETPKPQPLTPLQQRQCDFAYYWEALRKTLHCPCCIGGSAQLGYDFDDETGPKIYCEGFNHKGERFYLHAKR